MVCVLVITKRGVNVSYALPALAAVCSVYMFVIYTFVSKCERNSVITCRPMMCARCVIEGAAPRALAASCKSSPRRRDQTEHCTSQPI